MRSPAPQAHSPTPTPCHTALRGFSRIWATAGFTLQLECPSGHGRLSVPGRLLFVLKVSSKGHPETISYSSRQNHALSSAFLIRPHQLAPRRRTSARVRASPPGGRSPQPEPPRPPALAVPARAGSERKLPRPWLAFFSLPSPALSPPVKALLKCSLHAGGRWKRGPGMF